MLNSRILLTSLIVLTLSACGGLNFTSKRDWTPYFYKDFELPDGIGGTFKFNADPSISVPVFVEQKIVSGTFHGYRQAYSAYGYITPWNSSKGNMLVYGGLATTPEHLPTGNEKGKDGNNGEIEYNGSAIVGTDPHYWTHIKIQFEENGPSLTEGGIGKTNSLSPIIVFKPTETTAQTTPISTRGSRITGVATYNNEKGLFEAVIVGPNAEGIVGRTHFQNGTPNAVFGGIKTNHP